MSGQPYDLIVVDEAHKLSADRDADMRVSKTGRYRLGEALAGIPSKPEWDLGWKAPSLLLLTATPHMGKEYPYFALWRLLNADAISTPEALRVLPAECRRQHFIRRTKEEMVTLDGRPLYPVRQCDTLGFDLSSEEHALYEDATTYIRSLYNTAPGLNRSAARLVMSVFQRRLASSTAAMRESLQRRSERLARLIALVQAEGVDALRRYQAEAARKAQDQGDIFENKTADEESTEVGEDHEAAEDAALGVSTAGTLADLMIERDTVDGLVRQADKVLARGNESKFEKLLDTMREPQFHDEKMLIFTEHRDTANYLANRLEALGFTGQVARLHGGMDYKERDRQVELFRAQTLDGGAKYLIGTDAAGEGVNLQFCWLMVNYDIPWNPARLEQRMGRIHRYGQKKETVFIANLVATDTREGKVMATLLRKLEEIRKALGSDKVFDVIGRFFENVTLKSYLERTVQGENVADSLGGQLTLEQVKALQERDQSVYGHGGDVKSLLPRMQEDMERERYLRLMPGYIQGLVERAAPLLGLKVIRDDSGGMFHFASGSKGALDRLAPALETYPEAVQNRLTFVRPNVAQAEMGQGAIWLHPGEAVFDCLADWLGDRFGPAALRGGIFVDPTTTEDWLFHLATVPVLARADGGMLDYRLVALKQTVSGTIECCAIEHLLLLRPLYDAAPGRYAAARMARLLTEDAKSHLLEVEGQRAIQEHRARLLLDLPQRKHLVSVGFGQREVELLRRRKALKDALETGRSQATMEFESVKGELADLKAAREAKLAAMDAEPNDITLGEVRFVAHALAVPSIDAAEKDQYDAQVEATAMRFAMAFEQSFGATVRDVSKPALARLAGLGDAPGFDLLSNRAPHDARCIEVKGRATLGDVFLTGNEWSKAANLRDRYWLYVVLGCASAGPALLRIRDPFGRLTGTQKGGLTLRLGDLRAVAEQD
jgi:superfamily II DNA or RNA helicase